MVHRCSSSVQWRHFVHYFVFKKVDPCLPSYVAVNTTLLAFAADRRAAVDMDRKATAPAADVPCSNRLMSPARWVHSSKLAERCCSKRMGRTDGPAVRRTPYRYIYPAAHYAITVNSY